MGGQQASSLGWALRARFRQRLWVAVPVCRLQWGQVGWGQGSVLCPPGQGLGALCPPPPSDMSLSPLGHEGTSLWLTGSLQKVSPDPE